ncbi:hypothetical protein C0993_006736 [Termitomyces sp. T159_Od127]|nr:hypothetical protein C0993_006736 [Termitomyces sp. T159_Od127]
MSSPEQPIAPLRIAPLDTFSLGDVIDSLKLASGSLSREIEAEFDQIVQEQVAACLAEMIPQDLQDEIAAQEVELEELRIKLLNS